ncbi:MFS general substrate transporter [Fomitiporia mediterranea MF3/22]|uniref:MFS general substrate transporter n=1 Tax=Fomitiporia mediterranea (strain MF3/22) TaxID=694068 RepID=UPI00044086A6|nr:MFS general substrate transporter [Fomitiporia mediterranea MF3/22]EJD00226.1 MFS general substrate transporter [Fomitiporia mediterranea MF3/22]
MNGAKSDDPIQSAEENRVETKEDGTGIVQVLSAVNEVPDGGKEAWLVAVGAFFLALCTFGYFYSWGAYQAYYETVLLPHNTPSQIAWIGSLQYSLVFLPGIPAGRLFDLGYFKQTLVCALVLMIIADFLTAECTKYWQFILCQGLLLGAASGFIFIECITVISHWFSSRKPLAFAAVSFGGSLGGIIYPIMIRTMLLEVGFKWTVRTIAFINVAASIFAVFTMNSHLPAVTSLPKLLDFHTLASPGYVLYVASTFLAFLGLYTPLTFLTVSAEAIGMNANLAFYSVSLANTASAVGRLISGAVAVRYGSMNVIIICTAMAAVCTYVWPFLSTDGAFITVTVLYGITSGAFICLVAAPVAYFGAINDVGRRTGLQMTIMAIGALIGPPISGAIKEHHSSFHEVGIFAGTVILTSIFLMLSSKFYISHSIISGKF